MKRLLLIPLLFFTLLASAQEYEFGVGLDYDLGVSFPNLGDYSPWLEEKFSTIGFDVYVGIPKGRFMFYPTFMYTVPDYDIILTNHLGYDVPLGDNISVPYSTIGNGWQQTLYTNDYLSTTSTATMKQISVGTYANFLVTRGVEVGAGLFFRNRRFEITDWYSYDEYSWFGSTDTITDNYIYYNTHTSDVTTEKVIKYNNFVVPININLKYETGRFYGGLTLVYWVPSKPYFTIRSTIGYRFGESNKQ